MISTCFCPASTQDEESCISVPLLPMLLEHYDKARLTLRRTLSEVISLKLTSKEVRRSLNSRIDGKFEQIGSANRTLSTIPTAAQKVLMRSSVPFTLV